MELGQSHGPLIESDEEDQLLLPQPAAAHRQCRALRRGSQGHGAADRLATLMPGHGAGQPEGQLPLMALQLQSAALLHFKLDQRMGVIPYGNAQILAKLHQQGFNPVHDDSPDNSSSSRSMALSSAP